jgi:dienelactone hydrolase
MDFVINWVDRRLFLNPSRLGLLHRQLIMGTSLGGGVTLEVGSDSPVRSTSTLAGTMTLKNILRIFLRVETFNS